MRDTNKFQFFFIFGNSFLYKIIVSFTMVIKISPGGESAGGGRSTSKSTCVLFRPAFGDRPASSMSKFSASVNSDLGNGSFWVEIGDAEHIDVVENIREFDRINWPLTSEMFTFLDMLTQLAIVVSESSFGAYVCIRRPAGLHRDELSCILWHYCSSCLHPRATKSSW